MSDGVKPPGWYPEGVGSERWWDGRGWTDYTRPMADAPNALAPPLAPPPPGPGATGAEGSAWGATVEAPSAAEPLTVQPDPVAGGGLGRHPLAVVAFILAIVAFLFGLVPLLGFLAWVPGVTAVVLGVVVLARRFGGRGFAVTGVVLGAVAIVTGLAVSGAAVARIAPAAAATAATAATASAAHERQYLEVALDAALIGAGRDPLVGDARQAAHKKADALLLKSGYTTCADLGKGLSASSASERFVEGFTKAGGSDANARRSGKLLLPAIGQYLCPQHQDEAKRIADAL